MPTAGVEGCALGLPADFLISPDGKIVDVQYGAHMADHWEVDEVLAKARCPRAYDRSPSCALISLIRRVMSSRLSSRNAGGMSSRLVHSCTATRFCSSISSG